MNPLQLILWSVVAVATVLAAAATVLAGEGVGAVLFAVAQVVTFGAVGVFLIGRLRANPIGWLLAWSGVSFSLGYSADQIARWAFAGGEYQLAAWLSWYESWGFLLSLPLVLALLPLWFPDGRPPTPRWRWVMWTAAAGVGLGAIGQATQADAMTVDLPNPLGQPLPAGVSQACVALGAGLLLAAIFCGIASLLVRFRRASVGERQQIKWLVSAVAFAAVVFAVLGPVATISDTPAISDGALAGIATAMLAIPVAVAVAILRYRLYDIDRIISRTVSYGLVTAVLIGVYALIAVFPAAAFDLESDLLVAGATLIAAAAFSPLRHRIQTAVDRRFNRSRYDAHRTIQAFGRRLERQTQVEALGADLTAVAARALQPASISIWLNDK